MKMKSRIVEHWGSRRRITPYLIDNIFGDGLQTIYVVPLNTRPNYYVVQIDSKSNLDDEWRNTELSEIQEAIEEECGPCLGPRGGKAIFPAPDWDCGCGWGRAPEETMEAQNLRTTNQGQK